MRKKYPEPFKIGNIYYFTFNEPVSDKRKNKSTGETTKEHAREFIRDFMDELMKHKGSTFRNYAAPFFVWETCPRVKRKLREGKSIGKTHVEKARSYLLNHVFKDPFSDIPINNIKRKHLYELQDRLLAEYPTKVNTVNKILETVKIVLSEAHHLEDIQYNPGIGVAKIKYEQRPRGTFTIDEIKNLFTSVPYRYGPRMFYYAMWTAALTGMRSGEIRALRWSSVGSGSIDVLEAFKGKDIGLPKWNKVRHVPICPFLIHMFKDMCKNPAFLPRFVFSNPSGIPYTDTWIQKNFKKAMQDNKISRPNMTFHCFRHTLNTHLIEAGCDPHLVQLYMGWSPRAFTRVQAGYTHLNTEALQSIADKIQEIYMAGAGVEPAFM